MLSIRLNTLAQRGKPRTNDHKSRDIGTTGWTNRAAKNSRFARAGNILARLGFGAFAAPVVDEPNLDSAYAELLAGSGGKFTDWVEGDAGLRPRGSARFGSLVGSNW